MNSKNRLPREILKWLQGLDLTFAIKNVTRDFCNGFLIAEIFSRYFPADVTMHSYYNSVAMDKKQSNWKLIAKFIKKNDLYILEPSLLDDVLMCRVGASVQILKLMYQLLTTKTVHEAPEIEPEENVNIPAFAKPTASQKMRETLSKEPEYKGEQQKVRAEAILKQHADEIRQEKINHPERYNIFNNPSIAPKRHLVQQESETPLVSFVKQVHVKPFDGNVNISHLRANNSNQNPPEQSITNDISQPISSPLVPNSSSTFSSPSDNPFSTIIDDFLIRSGSIGQEISNPQLTAIINFLNHFSVLSESIILDLFRYLDIQTIPPTLLNIIISSLIPYFKDQNFYSLVVSLLLSSPEMCQCLLNPEIISIPSQYNQDNYQIMPLFQNWDPLMIARIVLSVDQGNDFCKIQILQAVCNSSIDENQIEMWISLFSQIINQPFLTQGFFNSATLPFCLSIYQKGFFDPLLVDMVSPILTPQDNQPPLLYKVITQYVNEGDIDSQEYLVNFMEKCITESQFFNFIYNILKNFSHQEPQKFQSSLLPNLLEAMESNL